jgi:predicted CXXCH cytochrome family protein
MKALCRSTLRLVPLMALGVLLVGLGCTEDGLVEDFDRGPFNPPPDPASGLLGYFDPDVRATTCGNCHLDLQGSWEVTAHAGAFDGLVNSGFAQDFCFGCHTVTELGNAIDTPAGWNVAQDPVFEDVQCESCHGPGADHVASRGSRPLASAAVEPGLTNGCGECHQDAHHPFVEEWSQSPHAEPFGLFFPQDPPETCVSCAAADPSCVRCHRGQGVLESWGETADYVEKFDAEHLPITCAVCHDPHDPANTAQLRFSVETNSIEDHLCAQCHNRRNAPDPTSSRGLAPHAPESELLIGVAGWFPPGSGINPGQIVGTHGTERNPTLCAQCHVAAFEVTDPATGDFVFNATGHLFRPIPCLDAEGKPLPFVNDCEISTTARSFASCVLSGCHVNEGAAFSAISNATTRVQRWADSLLVLLEVVDPTLDAAGGEIDPTNPTLTVAEGALFNYNLAIHGSEAFGTNTVVGSSVHNSLLVFTLLIASVDAVEAEYAAILFPTGRPASDLKARLRDLIGRVPR